MPKKKFLNNGFTIMEIMVALLLLSALSGVIFRAFNSITPPNQNENKAFNVARGSLEDLYEEVSFSSLDNAFWLPANNLNLTSITNHPAFMLTLDGTAYTSNYTVTAVAGTDYRKVEDVVTW